MKRKKALAVLILLSVVAIAGVCILVAVWMRYADTGLSKITEFNAAFSYNGKLLISEDGQSAMQFVTAERDPFRKYNLATVDLSPFGFEGETYSYFWVGTLALSPDDGYEGFWPVSKPERFVYRSKSGECWLIHPFEGLCYPMFADSIDGVDPAGRDVLAFSANGSYAVALNGETVTIYHTDPMNDSLRIVDKSEISLGEFGTDAVFCGFTSNVHAYFSVTKAGKVIYVVVDCAAKAAVQSPLDPESERGEALNRIYAQRAVTEEESGKGFSAAWVNLLTGEETLSKAPVDSPELFRVSPAGNYAAGKAGGETWILGKKRAYSLNAALEEKEILGVEFIYENVIFVTLRGADGAEKSVSMKICF